MNPAVKADRNGFACLDWPLQLSTTRFLGWARWVLRKKDLNFSPAFGTVDFSLSDIPAAAYEWAPGQKIFKKLLVDEFT